MASTTISTSTTVTVSLNTGEYAHITQSGSISNGSIGINSTADDVHVLNAGSILSSTPIQLGGSETTLTNTGDILGWGNFSAVNMGFTTENQAETGARVYNHGVINAAGQSASALFFHAGQNIVVNTGTIAARSEPAIVMQAQWMPGNYTNYIDNSGVIQSTSGSAILGYEDIEVIRNTGQIFGSIAVNQGDDSVLNWGQIAGNVSLWVGNDTYRGLDNGSVSGTVFGHVGNDTLTGGSLGDTLDGGADADYLRGGGGDDDLLGGSGNDSMLGDDGHDVMDGGTGNDTMRGGLGNDDMDGFSNNDLMYGNGGNDTLSGGHGNDMLVGGSGEDELLGGIGDDTLDGGSQNDSLEGGDGLDVLRGGDGNDTLLGEAGNDILQGGNGNDLLFGGLDKDIMNGGLGADTFRFTATNQSAVGANRDTIQDFEVGVDTLDLGALPGTLAFAGAGALIGGGTASVRAAVIGGGTHTLIQIDADGNGTVDSEILLTFSTGLTVDDFIL